jgi:CheY-like chemotaxis protein
MKERIERPAPADDIPEETVQAEILVIDDEVLVNNQILKILSRKDCRVEQAVCKNEAIEKIEKWA